MNFDKPIYAEIDNGFEAEKFRTYLTDNEIKFTEEIDNYKFVGDLHVFSCTMAKEDLIKANSQTDALYYQ